MSEVFKIALTSSLTVVSGTLIYVFGQIISKFFIEPIHQQSEIIGNVSDALIYYAREYSSPGLLPRNLQDEAHNKLRQLASLLKAKTYRIKWYSLFERLGWVPKLKNIEDASKELIGLSNSVFSKTDKGIENADRATKVRELLGIPSEE